MKKVSDIRNEIINRYKNQDFTIDKSGVKTIELIGEAFDADEDAIFGTPNKGYIERELQWYLSQSLNVNDIPEPVPTIWKNVADKNGFINSNYGWCIFSDCNYSQYANALAELKRYSDTRRAIMIYTRPSMWYEYNTDGRSDFMCTNSAQVFTRNNQLIYLVNQRSCDTVFGYKNDVAWHRYVHNKLLQDLSECYPDLKLGPLIYQTGSLHIYERHFKFIEEAL